MDILDRETRIAEDFIYWKERLHSEIRNNKLMYDVPHHYKWLCENELFNYYMDFIYLK